MKKQQIPIQDIYQASYLQYKGIKPDVIKQNGRAVFMFPAETQTFNMLDEYQADPLISVLDFVASLRRMRAELINNRDGKRDGGAYERNFNR